jgi:type IV secretory pathway VirB10-like protein
MLRPIQPPRLMRAVAIAGVVAIIAVVAASIELPGELDEPPEAKPEPKPERVVVVKVERLQQPKPERPQPQEKPQPKPQAQPPPPAKKAVASKAPAPKTTIDLDKNDVHGIPLRVLVPSNPLELEAHLKRSRSCLVVSRLEASRAEIVDTFEVTGGRARPSGKPPCSGVPRVIRDRTLIRALDDPDAQTRTRLRASGTAPGDLIVQIVLAPTLLANADAAAKRRLGEAPRAELAKRAAAAGYEIRCFAKADGTVACI